MTDYAFFKSRGVCPMCRKAPLAPGRAACFDCLERMRAYAARRRAARTKEQAAEDSRLCSQRHKDLRARRRAAGLCIDCGKPVLRGHVRCLDCNLKGNRAGRKIREKKRSLKPVGTCLKCNNPAEPGYLFCKAHLAILAAAGEKGRKNGREAVHKAHGRLYQKLKTKSKATAVKGKSVVNITAKQISVMEVSKHD